ncbi:MAG: ABC transporter ATP-binding protein [Bacteroidetes bacterium GWF2_29_10]|nr:MAG: ABC transporter ATP-binding protein [Bacteroidetes bacterium GWF2_29_10]
MNIFEAKNVSKAYANHVALNDVSINVPEKTIFGLLGPNGAGKTTLIRIINRITAPDKGEILFQGAPLSSLHVNQIGYLPEERGLYKKMKVGEQSLYLSQLKGISKPEALRKLKYYFEKYNLESWWNKKVEELSKGMQQKIQFIITILHEPKLLIFDEPFSGFDPINTQLLKDEILNLRANGATIILSTHNMESVEELCDNIALINNSQVILEGAVEKIKQENKLNLYEMSFYSDNFIASNFELDNSAIIEQSTTKNFHQLKIKLNNSQSPNVLLNKAMQIGEIVSFKEVLPSMKEIFIDKVNLQNLN